MRAAIAFLTVLSFAPSASQLHAENKTPICPASWAKYIEMGATFRNHLNSHQAPYKVLFEDDTGQVYDCLGLGISTKRLEFLSIFAKDIAKIQMSGPKNAAGFAVNQCTISEMTFPGGPYITIQLPLDEALLQSPMCQKRIQSSLDAPNDLEFPIGQ